MKHIRWFSVILVVLLAVSMLAACGKNDGDSASSGGGETLTVAKDGESKYTIIKPTEYTENEHQASIDIFKNYKEKFGVTLGNRTDDVKLPDDSVEIIIGNTNRPETAAAKEMLLEKSHMYAEEYIICVIDGSIVIYCVYDNKLPDAVDYFISTYGQSGEIAADLCDAQLDNNSYSTMSIAGSTKLYRYNIVRPHYASSYITQLELEKLNEALRTKTGYNVPIVEDAYVSAGDYEIIVGGSNRADNMSEYDRDDYEIKVEGNKIYLLGGSEYAVAAAVCELTDAINSGNLNLTEGVFKNGSYRDFVDNNDGSLYSLVWGDEFDSATLDEGKWHVCRGLERQATAYDGKPTYRCSDESTFVRNGSLYMCALKDEKAYYGGMIHTSDKLHYRYGYAEIKARVPDGDGFWAGFWTFGYDWSGNYCSPERKLYAEMDIMESYGNGTGFSPALHHWPTALGEDEGLEHTTPTYQGKYADNAARKIWCPDDKLFSDDFHTFGCMWTEERITITCDGNVRVELDTTKDERDIEAFNGYQFLILSLSTYSARSPLTPNATEEQWAETNKFIVDYIRLYQNDECELKYIK